MCLDVFVIMFYLKTCWMLSPGDSWSVSLFFAVFPHCPQDSRHRADIDALRDKQNVVLEVHGIMKAMTAMTAMKSEDEVTALFVACCCYGLHEKSAPISFTVSALGCFRLKI